MDAKQRLTDLRNQLYNDLPTGQINSFELIKIIKNHLDELDNFIDNVMSEGNTTNSENANCAIFDVRQSSLELELQKWHNAMIAEYGKDKDIIETRLINIIDVISNGEVQLSR